MKKEFVATYGMVAAVVGSVFVASALKVAQLPSSFSTRKTLEQLVPTSLQSMFSFVVGIFQFMP